MWNSNLSMLDLVRLINLHPSLKEQINSVIQAVTDPKYLQHNLINQLSVDVEPRHQVIEFALGTHALHVCIFLSAGAESYYTRLRTPSDILGENNKLPLTTANLCTMIDKLLAIKHEDKITEAIYLLTHSGYKVKKLKRKLPMQIQQLKELMSLMRQYPKIMQNINSVLLRLKVFDDYPDLLEIMKIEIETSSEKLEFTFKISDTSMVVILEIGGGRILSHSINSNIPFTSDNLAAAFRRFIQDATTKDYTN